MSNSSLEISLRRSNIQTAIASFIGMAMAIPVSLMIFAATQPAKALNDTNNDDKGYALYAQAFTQGFLANSESSNGTGDIVTCEEVKGEEDKHDAAPKVENGGVGSFSKADHHAMKEKLAKQIGHSFEKHVTTNITNQDSNNTVQSVVTVSHSNGAVVSTGTSTSGGVSNDVNVENEDSNNTTNEDSFNTTDSYNETSNETSVVIEDSFNQETETTNTTDNSTTIDDSFNKDVEVDVTIEDSNNTTTNKQYGYTL